MKTPLITLLLAATSPVLADDAPRSGGEVTVQIKVTEDGFQPREVKLKKGEPTTLVFTRVTENTCITAVDIPDEQVKEVELPLNKAVSINIVPKKAGAEKFHCSAMGMGNGKLLVTE